MPARRTIATIRDVEIAAVKLAGADGGHDHRRVGLEAAGRALDVHELLEAEVGAEAAFGDHVVGAADRDPVGDDRAVPMGDVPEGPRVDEGRGILDRLEQVRLEGVADEDGHRARRLEVVGRHRAAVLRAPQDHPAEARAKVRVGRGERQDRHHLARDRDVEARFALDLRSDRDAHVAERAVVHVHAAPPRDHGGVQAELVPVVEVVVDERGEQVVRGGDGVDVAREPQVDVVHREDLRAPAARGAALHAEDRAQGRLPGGRDRALTQAVQAEGEADGVHGLPLAERRGGHGGHDHELRARRAERLDGLEADLRLVGAVELDAVRRDAEVARDLDDVPHLRLSRDADVGLEGHRTRDYRGAAAGRRAVSSRITSGPRRSSWSPGTRWARSRPPSGPPS
jgi:hypothetical protein